MGDPIHLDYNATTPVAPEIVAAVMRCMSEDFGNPSSSHGLGHRAATIVAEARASAARLIAAQAKDVIFTGSATGANNLICPVSRTLPSAIL
jgi:cysteine desulfurase